MGHSGKKTPFIIQYNSTVILSFTFISAAVLFLGSFTNGVSTLYFFSAFRTSLSDPLMYLRLFTHVLGHANFEHFYLNFLIILLVGPMIEEKYGSKRLLILMVAAALITGIIHVVFFDTALLGASGIVFMLILLSSYANFEKGRIPLTLILVVIIFIGKEILMGFTTESNISYITHVIGGTLGGIFGYFVSGGKSGKGSGRETGSF